MEFLKSSGYYIINERKVFCVPFSHLVEKKNIKQGSRSSFYQPAAGRPRIQGPGSYSRILESSSRIQKKHNHKRAKNKLRNK